MLEVSDAPRIGVSMRLQDAFAVPVARDNPLVLGPIQVTYRGGARFVEFDETRVTAVLEAKGREILGMGTARASVSMELEQRDIDETEVRDDKIGRAHV